MKMTNDQRWTIIIEKACNNGYTPFFSLDFREVAHEKAYWWGDTQDGVLSLEKVIFCHDFAKALWGERKDYNNCTCKGIVAGQTHKVDCPTQLCTHCGGRKHISNPTDKCDHVHYPENCRTCELLSMNWKDHLQELVLAKDYLEYIESTI